MLLLLAAVLLADVPVAPRIPGAYGLPVVSARISGERVAWEASDGIHIGSSLIEGHLRDLESDTLALERDGDLQLATLDDEGAVIATRALHTGPSQAALARSARALMVFTGREAITGGRRVEVSADGIDPAAAATPFSFLVVWRQEDDDTIWAWMLDDRGGFVSDPIPLGTSFDAPTAASDGSNFLVAWRSVNRTIESVLIGPDARIRGPAITLVSEEHVWRPVATSVAGGFRVYFTTLKGRLSYVDVAANGSAGVPVPLTRATETIQIPEDASGARAIWIEQTACGYGSSLLAAEPGIDPVLVSTGEAVRATPVAVGIGADFAVAYTEVADAARYDLRLPDLRIRFSSDSIRFPTAPALATDGERVLAAWWELGPFGCNHALNIALFDSRGEVVGEISTITGGFGANVTAAWSGSQYAVAFTEYRFNNSGMLAVRVSRDGVLLDREPRQVTPRDGYTALSRTDSRDPSLVWTGSEYLVVRDATRLISSPTLQPVPPTHQIRAQRLSASLDRIGDDFLIAGFGLRPSAAASGTDTLVAAYGPDGLLDLRLLNTHYERAIDVKSKARPSIVAVGTSFVIAAGRMVFTLDGKTLTTLPEGTTESVLARNGTRLLIAYVLGNEVWLRELPLDIGRQRAARR